MPQNPIDQELAFGSGSGASPNKPLPEPLLTKLHDAFQPR